MINRILNITRSSGRVPSIAVSILLIISLAGCVPDREGLSEDLLSAAKVTDFDSDIVRIWGDARIEELDPEDFKSGPELKISTKDGTPRQDFLVLSGGGAKGAFGAGLLNGWTKSGERPQFSVVTGVSTGAIIAPFAYLGSSYDHLLTEFYTTYSTKDLLRSRGLGGVIGGSSAASSKPLEKLIAKYITPTILQRVAAEYRTGRYLLVGTTNLDAQRPVIWNMGEIAQLGNERALLLFRRVILASISIPGAFPPVLIDVNANGKAAQELHVDGGTTDNAILMPVRLQLKDLEENRNAKRRVFVVVNSNLSPKAEVVRASTIKIAARSIDTLIKQQTSGDVMRLYGYAERNGIDYNYLEIPSSFNVEAKELFDPVYMRALYDLGEKIGKENDSWKDVPPELQ